MLPLILLLLHGAQLHLPTLTPLGIQGDPNQENRKTQQGRQAGGSQAQPSQKSWVQKRPPHGAGDGSSPQHLPPRGQEDPSQGHRTGGEEGRGGSGTGQRERRGGAEQGGVAAVTYTGQQPHYG